MIQSLIAVLSFLIVGTHRILAFHLVPRDGRHHWCSLLGVTKESWSVADDWSSLSSEDVENASVDSSKLFNKDPSIQAAREMELANPVLVVEPPSEEDIWLVDAIDEIHNAFSTLDENMYDTSYDEDGFLSSQNMDDAMDQEIAMLVRCNEQPEDLLITEGRAIAPLTEVDKNDPFQLVQFTEKDGFQPTDFLKQAVATVFQDHCSPHPLDGVLSLDRKGVAKWMTKSLKSENEGLVSAHDSRVLQTLSEFGKYGSGRLEKADFEKLYLSTIIGDPSQVNKSTGVSPTRHLELRKPFVDVVWRDIRNHGMLSPAEEQREKLVREIRSKHEEQSASKTSRMDENTLVDECEILDFNWDAKLSSDAHAEKKQASKSWSSHKVVDLASDQKTPLLVKDGDFANGLPLVFIDEESCIGCMQCANVSPSSFMMLDSGRARTYQQRNSPDVEQAIASCPASCMHFVTYRELQEFESVRDLGDGKTDHRYLGRQQTPLHVAGMDSDKNRRSSWYHTLKHRCLVSSECPQKGCYDCPKYSNPGDNPFFKANLKISEHARAVHFMESGDADLWRKTAEL
eukprot:scaffold834_cov123-Cylindrotheca_fusiformis.AAC.20